MPPRPQAAQRAAIDRCPPELVEQYFEERPLQSVLFQRSDLGVFVGQFKICEHEFFLDVPTFDTVDGRNIPLSYRILVDTENTRAPSGCIRRESVQTTPISYVVFCFVGPNLVFSGGDY